VYFIGSTGQAAGTFRLLLKNLSRYWNFPKTSNALPQGEFPDPQNLTGQWKHE
jgi:hypothetical protein